MSNRQRINEVQLWTDESDALICLRQARDVISKPRNWCQGALHKRRWYGAHAYCALGAIELVADNFIDENAAIIALQQVIHHVSYFNDHHTHEEVLAAFDKAITIEESKHE